MCNFIINKTTDGFRNNRNFMSKSKLEKFSEQFGEYIYDVVSNIGCETAINYIPLRNHTIAVGMLSDDKLYNELSDSEIFDWKSKFLTPEQESEHYDLMTQEFRKKCFDWLYDNEELTNVMELDYSEIEIINLFDQFIYQYVWRNWVGDIYKINELKEEVNQ